MATYSSTEPSSRLPMDEDQRIIEEARSKLDRMRATGYSSSDQPSTSTSTSMMPQGTTGDYPYSTGENVYDRGRHRSKSPIRYRHRSPSPSPVARDLRTERRSRSVSPPPRATAPIEVMHEHERDRYDPYARRHYDIGYGVQLPTGGPLSKSPDTSPSSSPSVSRSPSPTRLPKESKRTQLRHPVSTARGHGKLSKKHPMGLRTIDLDTRVARIGKHGENVHFITFGKMQVRLIRGKYLPKNGIMTVYFYLPSPSIKSHSYPFGVSREIKRVENYTWDETFTTNVELETKENALEITRNLVVCLHYTSPHLRRNLGDMEGTVDISEMIRSCAPMHSNILKLVLYPIGSHKKAREASIDDKYRAKLYLEVLWKPSEAFRHSFAGLMEDYKTSLNGIKTRNWRLNVAGFAPYGTSYGLIWLQNVAQQWVEEMGDVIHVINVTSSVQPGPFNLVGRSQIWEAVVSVWYRIDEHKLRAHAQRELEMLEGRERELEERTRRRRQGYGSQFDQFGAPSSGYRVEDRGYGGYGGITGGREPVMLGSTQRSGGLGQGYSGTGFGSGGPVTERAIEKRSPRIPMQPQQQPQLQQPQQQQMQQSQLQPQQGV